MKKISILSTILILLGFSACIKVQDEGFSCARKNEKPVVSDIGDSLYAGANTYLTVDADNYSSYGTELKLIAPNGVVYSSGTNYPFVVLLSTANQGTFKLIAGADSYCASDTCRFVVTVATSAPACGMAANSFKPGSSPAVTTPHTTSTNYSYYYKAIWSFSPGNVTMYFGDRPGQSGLGVYKVKYTTNYTSLADNECAILYTNQSASYAGASGYIFTSYSHSTSEFTVSFCDLAATSSTPGNLNLSGNMQTHY